MLSGSLKRGRGSCPELSGVVSPSASRTLMKFLMAASILGSSFANLSNGASTWLQQLLGGRACRPIGAVLRKPHPRRWCRCLLVPAFNTRKISHNLKSPICTGGWLRTRWQHTMHTFSAFWLRSSVVSVLISLISDTDLIEIEDIKLIFDVARIASGLPVLSVTGCLCIAVSQSTADPARGFLQGKKNSP